MTKRLLTFLMLLVPTLVSAQTYEADGAIRSMSQTHVWNSGSSAWDKWEGVVTGPLTDVQLRATPVPISGTITANQGTPPWFVVPGPDVAASGSDFTGVQTKGPFAVDAGYPTAAIQLSGVWSGTIVVERSVDGVNYEVVPLSTGLDVVTLITVNGIYVFPIGAAQFIQFRSTSWSSGTGVWTGSKSLGVQVFRLAAQLPTGTNTIGAVTSAQLPGALISGRLDTNLGAWLGSTAPTVGQKTVADSVPMTLASDQPAIKVGFAPGATDVFGRLVGGGSQNSAIDISFFRTPPGTALQVGSTGTGSVTQSNGGALFSTGVGVTSSASGNTQNAVVYRAGSEMYSYFTISFTTPTSAASNQRIGLYDANNGFFIGYTGTTFGITTRVATVDTQVAKASWNLDTLTGVAGSKFTRAGVPEAIDLTKLNVFRIRYGWLGSAPVYWEVLSPDGEFVTYHVTRQPNNSTALTTQSSDLPMTLEVTKTASDATNLQMFTGSWAAGVVTSGVQPATANNLYPGDQSGTPIVLVEGAPVPLSIDLNGNLRTQGISRRASQSFNLGIIASTTSPLNTRGCATVVMQLVGVANGNVVVEAASTAGIYATIPIFPVDSGNVSDTAIYSILTTASTNLYLVNASGYDSIRLRETVLGSGSVTATLQCNGPAPPTVAIPRIASQWTAGSSPTATAAGNSPRPLYTPEGHAAVTTDHPRRFRCAMTSTATGATVVSGCFGAVSTMAAPGAGLAFYITGYSWSSSIISTTANFMELRYGTGGTCGTGTTAWYRGFIPAAFNSIANGDVGAIPIRVATNNEVCFIHASAGTRLINITGYVAP